MSKKSLPNTTRRHLLILGTAGATSLAAGSLLWGCGGGKKELSCMDVTGLTGEQRRQRNTLAYVDKSPEANKLCNNCNFYKPPKQANTCGGCTLIAGPVHPKGHCKSWAPKPT